MSRQGERAVAVVGAGAAGVMAAARLTEAIRAEGSSRRVVLIGDTEQVGRGVAYGTTDERHLLNVPAGKMSAVAEDPGDFVRWLRHEWRGDAGAGDFAPRLLFGRYLAEHLEAVAGHDGVLRHLRDRVLGVARRGTRLELHTESGATLIAGAVVLATGTPAPSTAWAPPALAGSSRFVVDPWARDGLSCVPDDQDVLVVGTGLTMVDVAVSLERPGRIVHAVSRHGLVPRSHAEQALPGVTPVGLPVDAGLPALREALRGHVRTALRRYGDWRPAIDGLRPLTATVWNALPYADREDFLAHDLRAWEVLRHRLAPPVARALEAACRSGRCRVGAGEVREVRNDADDDFLDVELADGRRLRVGAVINASGAQGDPSRTRDPLADGLLADEVATVGPHLMGYSTDEAGRLLDADGRTGPALWALGSLRRGTLFESTAFPEIRAQARELSTSVLAALPVPPAGPRTLRDRYGLEVSTGHEVAVAWDRALRSVLMVRSDAEEAVADVVALDPGFALAHALSALLADQRQDHAAAARTLTAARQAATRASARERSFVHAVGDLLGGRPVDPGRGPALLRHLREWPRDALAVSVAVPTIAFAGVSAGRDSEELIESLAPAYGDDGWFAAQLAFVRQDQGRWHDAEALAAHALAEDPTCGHAVHARTHVFYETGDHAAGLAWLDGWLETYGPRARHRAHFSWHAALHELDLGDDEALRRRFARELAPPAVTGSRALVDSASLIWRRRVTGSSDDLPIAPILAAAPTEWLTAPPSSFAGMHGALALAAAADLDGLEQLRRYCARRSGQCFAEVVAPLCAALADVVGERWSVAASALGALVPRMVECGGSAAQREVVEDTWIHALAAAGRGTDAARALSARLDRRPSQLDHRRLAALALAGTWRR